GRDRVPIEARAIAAAASSIAADAADGRFRAELLRRFGPSPIAIPALADRAADLPAIVARVAADLAAASGRPAPSFTPGAVTMLSAVPWRRNLDELRATLARVLARIRGPLVRQEDLLPGAPLDGFVSRLTPAVSLREARRRFEREYIATVLEQHGWRMSA